MSDAGARRWQVIVNPAAGSGRGARRAAALADALRRERLGFDVHDATSGVRALARELVRAGHDRFLAAGGDGTVNAVVNALHDEHRLAGAVVAAMPLGSGNDWVRNQRAPRRPAAIARALAENRLVQCPVGLVTPVDRPSAQQRCFVNAAGVGFDVRVIERAPRWRSASLRYVAGVCRAFAGFDAPEFETVADGEALRRRLLLAMCALGPHSGGGMCLAPHAVAAAGRLAVTTIDALPWWRVVLSGYRLYDGTIAARPEVLTTFARSFEVRQPRGEPVQADGDIVTTTPVRFSLLGESFRTVAAAR